jgi:multidrug efflux system outer membrane protein
MKFKQEIMMNTYKSKGLGLLLIVVILASCGVAKKYESPEVEAENLYRDQTNTDTLTIADKSWENLFTDPVLKQLIQQGLSQNYDLRNAIQNIVQAQATLNQSKLAYLPTLQADANVTRNKQSVAGLNFPPGININTLTSTHKLQLGASWEIDFWGKLGSAKRAAIANLLQTDAAKRAVQTQLIADIANNYYQLLALDKQLEITEKTLQVRISGVETMKALKESAIVTGAAVVQSEANRYAAEVSIPDIKRSIRETENALNILLGKVPGPIERSKLEEQQISFDLNTGIPAQLLQNRPDVQRAEYAFRVAFEQTKLAKSYFYPSLLLTANTGFSNLSLTDFFDNSLFYTLFGGLTQPILNRGANKARLATAKSQQIQALNNFQKTLLVAGQEVSNALYSYKTAQEKEESRNKQIIALEKSVEFTQELLRYSSATNYTDVLTSEQSLLSAELSGVGDQLQKLQAQVNLYRALGGGWK